MEINNVCSREKALQEELSNINIQLTAIGQRLIELGSHLKEDPARIRLINCDLKNSGAQCAFSMDFNELQECPSLIARLLSSYHELQNMLREISSQIEDCWD